MVSLRIGKDIMFSWEIITNGSPVPLEGRNLLLQLIDPRGGVTNVDFTTSENVIYFTFYGNQQKYTGIYKLSLWENYGEEGQSVVDKTDAFRLVPATMLENTNNNKGDIVIDSELSEESENAVQNKVITAALKSKAASGHSHTSADIIDWNEATENFITEHQDISGKQDNLVSGENIKTINNQSILGSGNISISGEGETVSVDSALDSTSENPVQNKIIKEALDTKAPVSHTHPVSQISDWASATANFLTAHQDISGKQDKLISGTNIKTINNQSLLGEGDITIEGGGASIEVDSNLDVTSTNPLENKVITQALNAKQKTLVSGTDIKTINGESILGSGDLTVTAEGVVPSYTVKLKGVATEKAVKNKYTSYSLISDIITSSSARPTVTATDTYNSLEELFTAKSISNPTNPDFILDRVSNTSPYFYVVYYKGTMFTTTPYYFTVDQITGLMTAEETAKYGDFSEYVFTSQERIYCRGFEGNRDFYVWNGTTLSVTPSSLQTVMYLQGDTIMNGENTVYEIVGDIDLCGDTITPAKGSVIKYGGGKIKNGTINGKNGIWIDCSDIVFFENMRFEEMVSTQVFKDTWFADVFYEGSVGGLSHLSLSRDYYITSDSMQINGMSNSNRMNNAPHEMLVLYGNNHTITLPAKMYKRGTTGFQFLKMLYIEVFDLNIKMENEDDSRLTAVFDVNIGIFHNVKSKSASTFSAAYTNTAPSKMLEFFDMYPQLQYHDCDIRVPWFAAEGPFNTVIARNSVFARSSADITDNTIFSISPYGLNESYVEDSYIDFDNCYVEGGWETPNHGRRYWNESTEKYDYYYALSQSSQYYYKKTPYTNRITYNKVKFKNCELVLPYIGVCIGFNQTEDDHSGTTSLAEYEDCRIFTGSPAGRFYTDNLIFKRCYISLMYSTFKVSSTYPFILNKPTGKLEFTDCVFDCNEYTSRSGRHWDACHSNGLVNDSDSLYTHYALLITEYPSDDFKVILKNNTFIEGQYKNKVTIYCDPPTNGTFADRVECSGNRYALSKPRILESRYNTATYAPWSSAYGNVTDGYWTKALNNSSRARYILPIEHTSFRGSEAITSSPYSFDACTHDFDYSVGNIYNTSTQTAYYIYDAMRATSRKIQFE